MLKEKAQYYYVTMGRSCSESILMAASDVYGLNVTDEEIQLFAGFRGGMGCGSTCGCLTGAMGALSRKYAGREDLKDICGKFAALFREKLASDSIDCSVLEPKYKNDEVRCGITVDLAADALSEYIQSLEA